MGVRIRRVGLAGLKELDLPWFLLPRRSFPRLEYVETASVRDAHEEQHRPRRSPQRRFGGIPADLNRVVLPEQEMPENGPHRGMRLQDHRPANLKHRSSPRRHQV
jgi:hypothetical protein